MRKSRASLSDKERQAFSAQICSSVISHPLYQQAEEIYCYVSFGEEVITLPILEHAWKCKKRVAVPKILENDTMEFFYIKSMEELSEGVYGILEPADNNQAAGNNALVLMPGVAFDRSGGRVGYGKGYYDRYLTCHPHYKTMALAFEIQCLEAVPTEPHDIRPGFIMTEKEIYQCKEDFQMTRSCC